MSGLNRSEIRKLLMRSRREADRHIFAIRNQVPLDYPTLRKELVQYVLAKFLLTWEDYSREVTFHQLAELSMARSMQISPDLVKEFDTARSCDGATSVMAKKVLLFLALQRALSIELPAEESAKIQTMEDFAWMVWHTLADDKHWRGRLDLNSALR